MTSWSTRVILLFLFMIVVALFPFFLVLSVHFSLKLLRIDVEKLLFP